jgi:hypothetical protein
MSTTPSTTCDDGATLDKIEPVGLHKVAEEDIHAIHVDYIARAKAFHARRQSDGEDELWSDVQAGVTIKTEAPAEEKKRNSVWGRFWSVCTRLF